MRPFFISIIFALVLAKAAAASVGFQQVRVPDAESKPLSVGIWYPSKGQASSQPLAMFIQFVMANGKISGDRLPLILMSGPTGGSLGSNYDTALALAQAGFVVAAITHTGDNYADRSYTGSRKNLIDRPRQVKLVTDYMVSTWAGHAHLDPNRIGIFGFSLGGFTALVEIGGTPDLRRTALYFAPQDRTHQNAASLDSVLATRWNLSKPILPGSTTRASKRRS